MTAYGRSHRGTIEWAAILLTGVVVQVAVMVALPLKQAPWWVWVLTTIPFFSALAIAVIRQRRARQARLRAIRTMLEAQGYLMDDAPSPERADVVFAPVAHLAQRLRLRDGARHITWLALRAPSRLIFEHEVVTGSGKTTAVHTCTVIVIAANDVVLPGAQFGTRPWMTTERARLLERRLLRRTDALVATQDVAFDRDWVTIGDTETARALLNATVRARLADSPTGEVWHTGEGSVCCAYRGALAAEHLARMMSRCDQMFSTA